MTTPLPAAAHRPSTRPSDLALGTRLFHLLLLAGVLLVAGIWLGIRVLGQMSQQMVAAVPGVQAQFGEINNVDVDWTAITAAAAAGRQAVILNLQGVTGAGRLEIDIDPASGVFRSARLTLPSGEVREFDAVMLARLQALQEGQLLPLLPLILPAPAAQPAPEPVPAPVPAPAPVEPPPVEPPPAS